MGSLTSLRQRNVSTVLKVLRQHGGMTQVELAEATLLSTATISSIVRELSEKNEVETTSVSRNGRHAWLVTLAAGSSLAAGISIDDHGISIATGDANHGVVSSRFLPLAGLQQLDTTLIRLIGFLREMLEEMGRGLGELKAIVVALPAPLDGQGNAVIPNMLPGWSEGMFSEAFVSATGKAPSLIGVSDASCRAYLETSGGVHSRVDTLYIHADDVISGSLVLNGKIYHGSNGVIGQFGHLQVDPNGAVCACGRRGCLNTVVGAPALRTLMMPSRGDLTLRDILNDARDGDTASLRLMEEVAETIARTVEPVVSMLGPDEVVIGGSMAKVGKPFFDAFAYTLDRQSFPAGKSWSVVPGPEDALDVARGALFIATDKVMIVS